MHISPVQIGILRVRSIEWFVISNLLAFCAFHGCEQYACRKTLADSRPRVRGRFARNEDHGESSAQAPWNQIEDEDDEENWMHLFDVNYIPIPQRQD